MFELDTSCEDLATYAGARDEPFRQPIPRDLDLWAPGPQLAAVLSSIDRSRLSGHDLVVLMQARNRQVAHDQAELLADMVEVSHCVDGDMERVTEPMEYAADEIRAALTLTRRAAEAELDFATELREMFPQVWQALRSGSLDVRKARVIVGGVAHLSPSKAADIANEVLDRAPFLTTGQLRARISRLCLEIDAEESRKRYEQRLADRRIEAYPNPEGTVDLNGRDLPPNKVAAIGGHIESTARRLKSSGDTRTMDQLRADIYVDLLLGRSANSAPTSRGVVTMTASLETLAGLSDDVAEIPGFGPVISDVARQVLSDHPNAELRYRVTADDGDVLIGTPSRFASKHLRTFLETRDQTCVRPGCRMPATECDIDHRQRWADGGATDDRNDQPLCRHDHMVKDSGGWALDRRPDGSYVWISRLGHRYTAGRSP